MSIAKLTETKFKINLGFLELESTWEIDEIQKKASWEMYVELATRITTAELKENEGLLRETLSSLYPLFGITRELLKRYGPHIATPTNPNDTTFGHLAVNILNKIIRPVLAKWHPLLLDWEQRKPIEKTVTQHESEWTQNENLRNELNRIRKILIEYANILGAVSEVPNLIEK
ncbi:MAG: hypothetical protein EHM93_16000 [Bacteroidales bacterium]|nr:MAG: hypothetical protein EHM93_16000 [Bacteroidales bacterium]